MKSIEMPAVDLLAAPKTCQYQHEGDAVPTILARKIANTIAKFLADHINKLNN